MHRVHSNTDKRKEEAYGNTQTNMEKSRWKHQQKEGK